MPDSPWLVAERVAYYLEPALRESAHTGAQQRAAAIMAPQRGTPRTAQLRAYAMWVWRHQHKPPATFTATGAAFGRDRRNVARAFAREGEVALERARRRVVG